MPRNAEVIRQWKLLRHLAAGRTNTIPRLSAALGVTTRTIRRDLEALQQAGFPIYDDTVNGTKFWRVNPKAVSAALQRNGFSLPELAAFYFSRALLECFVGTHLLEDLETALDKVEGALSPQVKKFLDSLPRAIRAKAGHRKPTGRQTYQITSKLLETILSQTVVSMRYHSKTAGREKDYLVHPYRLVYVQGGLYLIAFVPAYAELRTFAVERIRRLAALEERFEPMGELEADPFGNSLGVHRGPTTKVRLRFDRRIASSIRERVWHPSQQLKDRPDGSLVMTLDVCDDYALRSWILGFGRYVRVIAPAALVDWAEDELDGALRLYTGDGAAAVDPSLQPALPFVFGRLTM